MLIMLAKDFIKNLENTYHDEKYFTIVGWEVELENLYEECKVRKIPTESKIYPVCVFRGIHIKGIYFDKKYEKKMKSIINKGYSRLVMNGKNPFI